MADDDNNNGEEQEKPKSKMLLIIIIAVLVVLLIGGGVAAFFMLSGGDDPVAEESSEPAQKPAIYFDFKPPFVVNYQWKGRQRYVQISLTVMTRDAAAIDLINTHMPLVRNNLVMILGAQDFETLRTTEGKEALRQTMLEEIQKILLEESGGAPAAPTDGEEAGLMAGNGGPVIEQVLFTNFVMQ